VFLSSPAGRRLGTCSLRCETKRKCVVIENDPQSKGKTAKEKVGGVHMHFHHLSLWSYRIRVQMCSFQASYLNGSRQGMNFIILLIKIKDLGLAYLFDESVSSC
jgi:hypothetical protein